MPNGYEIIWTDNAQTQLAQTLEYFEENFPKSISKLSIAVERFQDNIEQNPYMYPLIERLGARKATFLKYNSVYYRIMNRKIEILHFYSNRQKPL
jgi:hypothetical protein